jgi:ADP-heptose:LPS heptosyltransferase
MEMPLLRQPGIDSVAVFRALYLGDMLCAVPALRALRSALPAARIVLVGLPWAEQFAERYSAYIDGFVAFPGHPDFPEQAAQPERLEDFYAALREQRFALALQMHGSGIVSNGIAGEFGARFCAGFHPAAESRPEAALSMPYPESGMESLRLLRLMKWLGAPVQGCGMTFPLTQQDWGELEASGVAARLRPGRYICVHAGARKRDKCWPPRCFAAVADEIAAEFGLDVVLTGSAAETDLAEQVAADMRHPVINTVGPLSIGAMAALMRGARLLVCNDTGVSHIAAGLELPSVVIFSKADMRRWAPLNRRLHRCLRDPAGEHAELALAHARALLRSRLPLSLPRR